VKREDVKRDEEAAVTYEAWEVAVPAVIKEDTLWRVEAYRLGLFLSDLAWEDAGRLLKDRRTWSVADQLYRAAGNISSNVSEGYSHCTGKDRARFYEYALGSTREMRDWYYKGRHVLDPVVVSHRLELSTRIIRLTITMVCNERSSNRRIGDDR
jgi:four helix bundle protein